MVSRLFSVALIGALFTTFPVKAETDPAADPYSEGKAIIADIGKIVTPNGVQESFAVELGGARQWITVRGADRGNPILLFVHGGPAAPETPMAWGFQRPWEDFFTVVQWDQRASGKSFRLNDPSSVGPLEVERYRDDAIELIEFLREKYGEEKVVLFGHSWGTVVGLSVAMARPDLLHAYVAIGPLIDARENERVGYQWTLEQARKDGNAEAVRELEALAPYPGDGDLDVAKVEVERKWNIHYGGLAAGRDDAEFYFDAPKLSPEYTPADIKAWGEGSAFTMEKLWPKLASVDFSDVQRLKTPIFLFLGRHDYTTPSSVAADWFEGLRAPKKAIVWFENSAHLPFFEEPGRMLMALVGKVRPLSTGRDGDEE